MEIHYINNHKSARSRATFAFNDLKFLIGATATPITNNPENLFGIFNLIEKDLFKTYTRFAANYIKFAGYGRIAGCKNEEHLRKVIAPYIFIKSEEEVADQLPTLIVNQVYCNMSKQMAQANQRILDDLELARNEVEELERKIKNPKDLETNEQYRASTSKIMACQTFLQELVDDPRLLYISDSKLAKQYIKNNVPTSEKLVTLLNLIDEITNSNAKVCVFTKFQRMQLLIQKEIEKRFDFKCAIVNGSQSAKERYEQAYTLFKDDDNYKVLIGTDAMAEGISLSHCNYLIEYDLADSYAIQTQRHGRIKRANSIHKTGYIYQIICKDSWDEIQQRIIAKKENYDNSLIKSLVNE